MMENEHPKYLVQAVASEVSMRPMKPPEHIPIREVAEAVTRAALSDCLLHDEFRIWAGTEDVDELMKILEEA